MEQKNKCACAWISGGAVKLCLFDSRSPSMGLVQVHPCNPPPFDYHGAEDLKTIIARIDNHK